MTGSERDTRQHHSLVDDVFGVFSGSILFAIGLSIMHAGGLLTGGTAGLALLAAKHIHHPVGTLYFLIGIPFLLLAWWKKGWRFTLRSVLNLALVSYLVNEMPRVLHLHVTNQLVAAVMANTLLGVGMVVIFRHFSSLGGFNVIALLAQEKLGVQAGYVQLGLDSLVLAVGFTSYSTHLILISLVGAAVLNLSLALNHRSDRYVGYSFTK